MRISLISTTALLTLGTLLTPETTFAACNNNTPSMGVTVTCTGTDNTGISGNATGITVNVQSGATISTGGATAIDLGSGMYINNFFGTITSDTTTITSDGGTFDVTGASVISTTGTAIQYTGAAGTSLWVTNNNGTITGVGTAIDYGNASARFRIVAGSSTTNGNVVAGGGTDDRLYLIGSGNTSLDLSEIGTKYIGFDKFYKEGSGTWTLTGSAAPGQNWTISAGTLQGDTTSMSGNLAVSGGANVTFNLGPSGVHSNVISGAGSITKTSSGTLTLSGANTYTGGTIINGGVVSVSADNNLGGTGDITFDGGSLRYGAGFTTTRNITLNAGGGTFNTNGFNSSINGAISGTGSLTKTGGGKLTISGTNTYTGGTIISGGQLQGTTSTLQGNITNNSTLIFGQEFNGTYGDVISGTGALTKSGIGTLSLTGTNTYSGATAVSAGTLAVNGSIANSATTIALGGTLGGTGTTGDVIANGKIAPGNSIGTLNVAGNLTYNVGSTYEVEIDDAGNSDKAIATGNITINGGTVDVQAAAGSYGTSTNYTILQGTSVAGTFDSVTSNLAFLDPTLTYNAADVQLTMTRNDIEFASLTTDPTGQAVASAAEELGSGNSLYDAITGLSSAQATEAFKTLSAEHNVNIVSATSGSSAIVRNIVFNRAQNLAHVQAHSNSRTNIAALTAEPGQGAQSGKSSQNNLDAARLSLSSQSAADLFAQMKDTGSLWGEVFGSRGSSDSQRGIASQRRESGGFVVGTDFEVNPQSMLGFFGGWERGEIYTYSQNANSDIDSYHAGIYSAYTPKENWRISGGLNGAYHKIDTVRQIDFVGFNDTATGDTNGYTLSGYVEGARTFDLGAVAFEPYVALNVTHTRISGYSEQSANSAGLTVDDDTQTLPGHVMGVRAGKGIALNDEGLNLNLQGKIGWEHTYGNTDNKTSMRFTQGQTQFDVPGLSVARNALVLGAGADTSIGEITSAYVSYNSSLSSDHRDHTVTLGIKTSF